MAEKRDDRDGEEFTFISRRTRKQEISGNNASEDEAGGGSFTESVHEPKPTAKPDPKPTAKPEPKPTTKPDPKPTARTEPKPDPKTKREKPKKSKAEREKELKRGLSIFAAAISVIFLFFVVVNNLEPKKSVEYNSFMVEKGELPIIGAHRGGAYNYPENTMLAYVSSVRDIGVGMIESDVRLTKDEYLVFSHDDYIDESCNVNGDISLDEVKKICEDVSKRHYIRDMTLEELLKYNFGYYFEDESGERIYKDVQNIESAGLGIATVDKLFDTFSAENPELLFSIEIKDGDKRGCIAADILANAMESYPEYRDRVVIQSFHDDVDRYMKKEYPMLLRGSSIGTSLGFILSNWVGLNYFDPSDFACLQIPMCFDYILDVEVMLDDPGIVERAHKRNISVQYWTVNDPDEMRRLIELGCDVIITDDPRLLAEVLGEYR